ncbi:hypothetical protein X474_26655 [Dethiosulfatarculus sandiegensis]|uniref:Uncharacterized protein n=1 Tax=Dethiosulfatarculus sandiegensis TaxID=1429043 RepID=A0A0D2J5K7_9BACT|nr:hypothetical protein X474_26655 [Dethiosulfatarculus sandiegensis]
MRYSTLIARALSYSCAFFLGAGVSLCFIKELLWTGNLWAAYGLSGLLLVIPDHSLLQGDLFKIVSRLGLALLSGSLTAFSSQLGLEACFDACLRRGHKKHKQGTDLKEKRHTNKSEKLYGTNGNHKHQVVQPR